MRPAPEDEGFTLIELLVAIALLGVLTSVIAAAFVATLRVTDEAETRLSGSHDAEVLGAYFVRDVQSAEKASTTTSSCGSGSLVLALTWKDHDGTASEASYRRSSTDASKLVRTLCVGAAAAVSVEVVQGLTQAPVVTCRPLACATARAVSMSVTTTGAYAFEVAATRRSR